MQDLLSADDFALFRQADTAWFLGVASDVIRDYCGWHIAPLASSITSHAVRVDKPTIVLPTLNLVSVDGLSFDGSASIGMGFTFTEWGRIDLQNYFAPSPSTFSVTYTHGFDAVPRSVAEVGYELASRAMEKASSAYRNAEVGPYRVAFAEQLGAYLDDSQKQRLSPYAIRRVW